jgi:hypothetical protein
MENGWAKIILPNAYALQEKFVSVQKSNAKIAQKHTFAAQ